MNHHHSRYPIPAVDAILLARTATTSTISTTSLMMGGYYNEPDSKNNEQTHMLFGIRCRETRMELAMDDDEQSSATLIVLLEPIIASNNQNDDESSSISNDEDASSTSTYQDWDQYHQQLVHYHEYQLALWFWKHQAELRRQQQQQHLHPHNNHRWAVWESPYSRGLVSLTVAAVLQQQQQQDSDTTTTTTTTTTDHYSAATASVTVLSTDPQQLQIIHSAHVFYNGGDPRSMQIREYHPSTSAQQEGRYNRPNNNGPRQATIQHTTVQSQ